MKSHIKPLQLVLLTGGLAAGVLWWSSREDATQLREQGRIDTDGPVASGVANEAPVASSPGDAVVAIEAPAVLQTTPTGAVSHATAPAPVQTDRVDRASISLIDSPVAEAWERQGIRREDIATAQARMQERGFPVHMQNDPGLVRQFLPLRDIVAVHATSVELPERAAAGAPVPFRMSGVHPDASYRFDRFEVVRDGPAIRIRAIGTKSGEPAPGVEIPVELEGAIEPLPPGEYIVEFPELGPDGARKLIIE